MAFSILSENYQRMEGKGICSQLLSKMRIAARLCGLEPVADAEDLGGRRLARQSTQSFLVPRI